MLVGANLMDADLSSSTLYDADLTNANLSGAIVVGANLPRADLFDTHLGRTTAPGQLPIDFPRGWDELPPGWHLYDDNGKARFGRSDAPAPSPR